MCDLEEVARNEENLLVSVRVIYELLRSLMVSDVSRIFGSGIFASVPRLDVGNTASRIVTLSLPEYYTHLEKETRDHKK